MRWSLIDNFQLLKDVNHKFMGLKHLSKLEIEHLKPYKLGLQKNLKVPLIFHASMLKPIVWDLSRPTQGNEPKFEVETMLKSRQLWGWECEHSIKWKGYPVIKSF